MYNEITVNGIPDKGTESFAGSWMYSINQGILTLFRMDPENKRIMETRTFNKHAWSGLKVVVLRNSDEDTPTEFEGITLRMN